MYGARLFFSHVDKLNVLGTAADDGIMECPNAVNGDAYRVTRLEREVVGRDDACAGEQEDTIGEKVIATEVVDEFGKGTDNLGRVDTPSECDSAIALDFDGDGEIFGVGYMLCQGDHRPDGAAPAVHFGLREVEGVFALDVT
jgi:hypothetical protein